MNLKKARLSKGVTQEEVAKYLGITRPSYTNYELGKGDPDTATLKKLADYFGVSVDYLLGKEVQDTITMDATFSGSVRVSDGAKKWRVPVIGKVPAGYPNEAVEIVLDYEEIGENLHKLGKLFGLIISGDSMEPEIMDGDTAIVLHCDSISSGKVGIIRINGDDVTCKKVVYTDDGVDLVPMNKKYGTMHFNRKEVSSLPVSIIGQVVEIRRTIDYL